MITGSGKNLASPHHPNYKLPYLQNYLRECGERKCEANAIVTTPEKAKDLISGNIIKYLGSDSLNRFALKREAVRDEYGNLLEETGLRPIIENLL